MGPSWGPGAGERPSGEQELNTAPETPDQGWTRSQVCPGCQSCRKEQQLLPELCPGAAVREQGAGEAQGALLHLLPGFSLRILAAHAGLGVVGTAGAGAERGAGTGGGGAEKRAGAGARAGVGAGGGTGTEVETGAETEVGAGEGTGAGAGVTAGPRQGGAAAAQDQCPGRLLPGAPALRSSPGLSTAPAVSARPSRPAALCSSPRAAHPSLGSRLTWRPRGPGGPRAAPLRLPGAALCICAWEIPGAGVLSARLINIASALNLAERGHRGTGPGTGHGPGGARGAGEPRERLRLRGEPREGGAGAPLMLRGAGPGPPRAALSIPPH